MESLQNEIMVMRGANDEREDLLQTLDNRDAELRSQHAELQSKLMELQNKKMQVDQLVHQLQSFGEDEEEDVGKVHIFCLLQFFFYIDVCHFRGTGEKNCNHERPVAKIEGYA